MISERGIFHRLGVSKSTVAGWKIYLREGKSISLDKMEEMLIKAGASVAQEKVWSVIVEPKLEKLINFVNDISEKKAGDSIKFQFVNSPFKREIEPIIYEHALSIDCIPVKHTTDDVNFTYTFKPVKPEDIIH